MSIFLLSLTFLSIHSTAAKVPYPLPFRLYISLLTVLSTSHHISNSALKALCCSFLLIFMVLPLSFTPCSSLTRFPQAVSFFWSIRAVSSSCSCLDSLSFNPFNRLLPPLCKNQSYSLGVQSCRPCSLS